MTATIYKQVSSEMLREALISTSGNVTHAAKHLQISKMTAYRLTKKFDLRTFARRLRIATHGSATGKPPMQLLV